MRYTKKQKSFALKVALFATGISGIVAEYILSTLASYFIGNAILQFTLIVSIMLFAMGLGSRLSKKFTKQVIAYFIVTELILSVLVSFSALILYVTYGVTDVSWLVIYILSIAIGLLIGLEIPFATRINDEFEELRLNISNILEKDYFGSLIGGLFFAFVGLPYLGLTYTPFMLGILNLGVSYYLFRVLKEYVPINIIKRLQLSYIIVTLSILLGLYFAKPIVKFGEQVKYKDKIVYTEQTKYQKIVLTKWKEWHSLYINGNQQLSSFDEFMYHEPMVHIPMQLAGATKNILVLGGGDGCLAREVLKYPNVEKITLVDLDERMIDLGKNHEVLKELNQNAMNNSKLKIVIQDAFNFLEEVKERYDVIFVDLPDPNNVDLNKLYTKEFYSLCNLKLQETGILITQAGSPYYATKAFYCIDKTMKAAGLRTMPMHNQILTLGEWGWVMAKKKEILLEQIKAVKVTSLNLKWLTNSALPQLTSFGKPLVDTTGIQINTIFSPKLYTYYRQGNWDLY
ncbi:polyamine aminopropyltransferase [Tenacibaculum maritimum]|uniref:Polyamine aminopropyltransferase n=1 Tax=Tenacibaculum maritimum NCIMB 2154 TaxID=1349785 RepID=A0A2H1EDR7_9FLAO|nr:polyamine aminopropyltransferase [Tenacibaculum maritimum]SFZ85080.1 Spermidine synthase with an N-terminal membrane domain [Tenacibaculum maritimum NCIMB 2154]